MILFKKTANLHKWLETQQKNDNLVGFVPTMGALHAGHLSLVEASKKENTITVSSIFVNPAQFNDPKDFEKYPSSIEKDIDRLEQAGCDVLLLPTVKEMYPDARPDDLVGRGMSPAMHYDLGFLETVLEGKYRPGHFQGVCRVVHRLLDIVHPDNLYLGQKDYQQCMVITKLVGLIKQEQTTRVNICPTLREDDGLAMSSRNMRLNKEEREKAATIFRSLNLVKDNLHKGNIDTLKKNAQAMLANAGFKVDYLEIADAKDLSPVTEWDGKQKLTALAAAFINEVRLIDNLPLN